MRLYSQIIHSWNTHMYTHKTCCNTFCMKNTFGYFLNTLKLVSGYPGSTAAQHTQCFAILFLARVPHAGIDFNPQIQTS